jgi:hypothetical protein
MKLRLSSKALAGILGAIAVLAMSVSSAQADDRAPARSSTEKSGRQLVCRTVSSEGTMELFVEWDGNEGKGSLEHVAPSGNVTKQRVRAERLKNMIVVDELGQRDLVVHAAVVAEKDGKRYMRVGSDGSPWNACQ